MGRTIVISFSLKTFGLALIGVAALVLPAQASTISTTVSLGGITGLSGFSGANIDTFDDAASGAFGTPLTRGNNTYSVETSATYHVDNAFIGGFNTNGVNSLHSCDGQNCVGSFSSLTISFGSVVSAIGFHWGASDTTWHLSAYDSGNNLLDGFDLPVTRFSNAGDFVGILAAGIKYAVLTGSIGDYVFVDDVATTGGKVSAVPVPAALPMFGAGMALLGAMARRRKARMNG
jgi:hypothetical protein